MKLPSKNAVALCATIAVAALLGLLTRDPWTTLVVILFASSAVWIVAVESRSAFAAWHHFYLGLALVIVGALVPTLGALAWLGVAVVLDDAWQDTTIRANPNYQSPLVRLSSRLARLGRAVIRKVTRRPA